MIPFTLHNTLLCYVHFSGSIETPSKVGWYTITGKPTDFLYNWEMTLWSGYKSYIWRIWLLRIFVSEITSLAQAWYFDNQREVTCTSDWWESGIGYPQSLIHDHEGRLLHVHCMILRKCPQLPANQMAAIFEANIHHHALVVSMCYSRHL